MGAIDRSRFRGYDTQVKKCDGFSLNNKDDRKTLENAYVKSSALYYKGQIPFQEILDRISKFLDKL